MLNLLISPTPSASHRVLFWDLLLFSLYINDLPDVCPDFGVLMYADDAAIITHGKDAISVASKLTNALSRVKVWLRDSCLVLNVI